MISMAAVLLPLGSFAQTPPQEWRVTLALESGPTSGAFSCSSGGFGGAIRVQDGVLSYLADENGKPSKTVRWQIPLSADGSADASVPVLAGNRNLPVHVIVPAGTGPRVIRNANSNACRYRFMPN
jgi:hypothetical protein